MFSGDSGMRRTRLPVAANSATPPTGNTSAATPASPVTGSSTARTTTPRAWRQGFLGSKFYTARPLYPLQKTVANLNTDYINVRGRTTDVHVIGPDWDLSGAVEDYRLHFRLGLRIAQEQRKPQWRRDDEFSAVHDPRLERRDGP